MRRAHPLVWTLALALGLVFAMSLGAMAAEELRIGVIYSSKVQPFGTGFRDGAVMAADEINAAGGISGRQVKLFFADEGFGAEPQKGFEAVKRLVERDGVEVMIGGFTAGVALQTQVYMAEQKKLFFSTCCSPMELIERVQKEYDKYKYYFRAGATDEREIGRNYCRFVVDYLKPNYGLQKVALLAENAKWSVNGQQVAQQCLVDNEVEVVYSTRFDTTTTDFSPIFSEAQRAGAEYLLVWIGYTPDIFVKQWYDLKVPIPMGGIEVNAGSPEFFKNSGGKNFTVTHAEPVPAVSITPKTLAVHQKFTDTFGYVGQFSAFNTYDVIYLLKDAVERTGSFEPDALVEAIENGAYEGAGGIYEFDKETHSLLYGFMNPNNPDAHSLIFMQIQGDGKFVPLWPKRYQAGEFMFPPWIER